MDTMRHYMSEIKNGCTTKSWGNLYGGDVVSNLPIMPVMINQEKNVEMIDV